MQARINPLVILAFALAPALSGCGKSNPLAATGAASSSGSAANQAAVSSAIAQSSAAVEDGLMEAVDQAQIASAAPAGAAALIHPITYWRHIMDVRRTFDFAFSDTDTTGQPTKAIVTIHKDLGGTFNIAFDQTPGDSMPFDSIGIVRKPLHDRWERMVMLKRVHPPTASDDDNEWKIVALTGVKVTSYDPASSTGGSLAFGTTRITQLRIQSASGDTTISDPLKFFWLRRTPAFNPGENVTLTATTLTNTDVVVLMRAGMRRRFHNNGDNTYTIFWQASAEDGLHHFGVNALSNGTLFDDTAPYDSQAWILPYHVNPSQVAEFMP